jgi:hypothetical protein
VQKVAFTLGGIGDPNLLFAILNEIAANPAYNDEQEKQMQCARDCFAAG